ncbi:hypothetical protein HDU86_002378 [Geranomyces michiganensis]|nr:hypothetical protein HDU86_002378 [Geranomyces michiganensis]
MKDVEIGASPNDTGEIGASPNDTGSFSLPSSGADRASGIAATPTRRVVKLLSEQPGVKSSAGGARDDEVSDDGLEPARSSPSEQAEGLPQQQRQQQQQRTRYRTQLRRAMLRFLRHAALGALCFIGAFIGKEGTIVVENETWGKTITGLAFGILVQISLVPIVECGRMCAQHWFSRKLTVTGMKAREMLTAWSALYSGSYRGVEDFSGIGPIAFFLILMYASEAVVIGAIGNLYNVVPTVSLKTTNELHLRRPMLSTNYFVSDEMGLAYEAYVNDASGRISDDWIEMTSESSRIQYMKDKATVSCMPDGSCKSVAIGVLNPIGISALKDSARTLPFTTLAIDDVIETTATMLEITNECSTIPADQTEFQGIIPDIISWVAIRVPGSNPADQQWLTPIHFGGHYYITMAPEIGTFALTVYHPNNPLHPIYTPPSGEIYMMPYAHRIPGHFAGMQYLDEYWTKTNLNQSLPVGFAVCKVTARTGLADVSISVTGKTQVGGVWTSFTRVDAVQQIGELSPLNFNSTEGHGSAVIAGHLVNALSCSWRICPANSDYTSVPFVSEAAGYLSIPPGPDGWDYAGGLAKVVQRMSEITLVGIAAVSSDTGRHAAPEPYAYPVPTPVAVPVKVYTSATHGRVFISTACVVILLLGGGIALAMVAYDAMLYLSGGFGQMAPGILMTDSIYYFLKSFHDSIVHPATPGMVDPHPDELREALGSKTFLLNQTLTKVGLEQPRKNGMGRSVSDFWIHVNQKERAST